MAASAYTPLQDRPLKDTICLFDVDGTLTPARLVSWHTPILPIGLVGSPVRIYFAFSFPAACQFFVLQSVSR